MNYYAYCVVRNMTPQAKKWMRVMKLTTIMLILSLVQVSAAGLAQNISLSAKKAPLKKVLNEIGIQTGYSFVYDAEMIKTGKPVTIEVNSAPLETVLNICFKNQSLTYEIKNHTIILKKKDEAVAVSLQTVKGKVTDEKGSPLPGVIIRIKDASIRAQTNADGNFSIAAGPGAVLVVSFIGYETQEIVLGNRETVNISLVPSVQALQNIVVIGYGTKKRTDLTGTVNSLQGDEIVNSRSTNAQEAMQGRLPGVDVKRTSGRPGADFSIEIRGVNSINGSTQPLYVIDGIPATNSVSNPMNDINPSDIERIDVLKDASSTAIYGSRGANGVVIITTKRGNKGALKINYDAYVGIVSAYNIPPDMDGPTFVNYARDFYNEAAQATALLSNPAKPLPTTNVPDANIFTATELNNIKNGTYTNWIDAIKQNGISTNHNLSITGGDDKTNYFMSAGFQEYQGAIKVEGTKKYTLKTGLDKTLNKTFKFGMSLYATFNDINPGSNEVFRTAYRLRPTGSAYNPDGSLRFFVSENETQITNPLFEFTNDVRSQQYIRVMPNVYTEVNIFKDLKFRTSFSPDITFERTGVYDDTFTKVNADTKPASGSNGKYDYLNYTFTNLLTYNKELGRHKFDVTLGAERDYYQYDFNNISVTGLPYKSLWYNVASVIPINVNGTIIQPSTTVSSGYRLQTIESYFLRANYSFNNRYLFTFTGRADGNSIFAPGHQWGYFPSGAFAWKINEEDFLKGVSTINELKLRLSAGRVGNAAVSNILYPYVTQATITQSQYNFGANNANGFSPANLANKDLTWERTTEYDAGLDVAVLKNRIALEVNYYNKTLNGAIESEKIPQPNGFSNVVANVGSIRNSGIEVSLNTVNFRSKDFGWTTNLNYSHNHNEVLDLFGTGVNDIGNNLFIGQQARVIYGYKIIGVWQQNEAAQAAVYGQIPGQYKIQDITTSGLNTGTPTAANLKPDGKINSNDRQILGSDIPTWTGGITNNLRYKNFDFNVVVYTRQGTYQQSTFLNQVLDGDQGRARFGAFDRSYWTPTNPSNEWANLGREQDATRRAASEYQNSSYTKISSIALGYTFPKTMLQKAGIQNLWIYVNALNPFLFTKFIGWDPETADLNSSTLSDFRTRTFMLGVNVTL